MYTLCLIGLILTTLMLPILLVLGTITFINIMKEYKEDE